MLMLAAAAEPAAGAPTAAEGEPVPIFTFPATNGYRVVAVASPVDTGRGERLVLFVFKRDRTVFYSVPDTAGAPGAVHADLGKLGEIDVRFVATGRVAHERSPCGKKGISYPAGRWEGAVDFRGEEGYTRARTDRARPYLRFVLGLVCPGVGFGRSSPGRGAELTARGSSDGSPVTFQAIKKAPGSRSYFAASIRERHGKIVISRHVRADGPPSDFTYAPSGQVAGLAPPAPFSGAIALRGNARRGHRWTGSLAVDFPGRSGVSLSGAAFRATLAHADFSGPVGRVL
jgi:hypothetical protein